MYCTAEAKYVLTDTKHRAASLWQPSYLLVNWVCDFVVYSCKRASGASGTMRRLANVERNSLMFSGNYHGGRRQRMYRTRAPQQSPRYHLLNVLTTSASPPWLSDAHLAPVLQFQTRPAAEFHRPRTSMDASMPAATASTGLHPILQSTAVLTLIVVASLSLVVGAIYVIIYFKSIKPMSARSRNYMQAAAAGSSVGGGGGGGKMTEDDGGRVRSTHPFFRRS